MSSGSIGVLTMCVLVLAALATDGVLAVLLVSQGRSSFLRALIAHALGVVWAPLLHYVGIRTWGLGYGMEHGRTVLEIFGYSSFGLAALVALSTAALVLWYRQLQKETAES